MKHCVLQVSCAKTYVTLEFCCCFKTEIARISIFAIYLNKAVELIKLTVSNLVNNLKLHRSPLITIYAEKLPLSFLIWRYLLRYRSRCQDDIFPRIELIPSFVLSSDNTNCKNDIQLFHQLFDEPSVYRDYH